MFKNKEKFDFLLESNKKPITFFLSSKKIIIFITSFLLIIAFTVFITINYFSEFIYRTKLTRLKNDNFELVETIQSMENRLDTVNLQIKSLFNKDKALRTYADIPEIDQDIRKLGIGGKIIHKTTKLDKFIPNDTLLISNISRKLSQLERNLELEKLSYKEIYDAVKNNKELIESTPSIRPVVGGYISSNFGYRSDPFTKKTRYHDGLDISAQKGSPVFATADGVVGKCSSSRGGYGNLVTIDHGYGFSTRYAHLKKYFVKPGQQITRGQKIGEVGNTGRSTGTHLHYEVRKFGIPKNPKNYYFIDTNY